MTITAAAADVIRKFLRSSDARYPVVYLGQVSNTPAEVELALKRGASKKELEEITLRAMKSEPKHLWPLVYPRSHFVWLTTTINGFRFTPLMFYPPNVRRAMKRGILDIAERGLVLRDADGAIVLPKPVAGAL
jgi:hypothetical protein